MSERLEDREPRPRRPPTATGADVDAASMPSRADNADDAETPVHARSPMRAPFRELLLGALTGLAFGFLLQKGGVAKYHILMGVLLLEDFTVVKVMGSAVIVGMIAVHSLHRLGLVELQFKPTWYAANVTGGLIFGLGFGLSAYCPGTASAALGQGNGDALLTMGGLLLGSLVFAEVSGIVDRTLHQWGLRGQRTLPEAAHLPLWPFIAAFALALAVALVLLDQLD